MSETLVRVDQVSKKYCRRLRYSLRYGLADICAEFFAGGHNHRDTLRPHEFWALKNVSFEIKRGECLGLVGPNGAGKSTLMRILSGLILPNQGNITVSGHVRPLLGLGIGFNPILTGRENVYINASFLGFSKKQISRKLDEIVNFAGIESSLDAPVQHYSSGMRARLGFAVALHTDPDVLLMDGVLAVGDEAFRAKCFEALTRLSKKAAVVLVSHSWKQVQRMCTDLIVLNQGEIVFQGRDFVQGARHYRRLFRRDANEDEPEETAE